MTNNNGRIVDDVIPFITEKERILDIGCEKGYVLFTFFDIGFSYLEGVDIDEDCSNWVFNNFLFQGNNDKLVIKLANGEGDINLDSLMSQDRFIFSKFPEKAKIFNKNFNFNFGSQKGDITNYAIEPNSFDVIIASNILHFLTPENQDIQIKKIKEGLKENGVAYISVNEYSLICESAKTNDKVKRLFFGNLIEHKRNGDTVEFKAKDEIRYVFTETRIERLTQSFSKCLQKSSDLVSCHLVLRK